jgi:hypothetical protein
VTALEQNILDTLLELERAASSMGAGQPKRDLRPIFARLDQLASELPSDTPSDLRHYLQRKSYLKARAFLQER